MDPLVLLFTLAVSVATGIVFGLAPLLHTRVKAAGRGAEGRRRARCDRRRAASRAARAGDGRGGAGRDARDWRGAAAAHGLQPHDGRRRLRSIAARHLPDDAAAGQLPASRRRARSSISGCSSGCAAVPGVQAASAMSGLPPNRPVNANDTDIDNYTAPPEGPVRERGLLPERDDGLLRDDGHPHRARGAAFQAHGRVGAPGRWPSSTRRWCRPSGRT